MYYFIFDLKDMRNGMKPNCLFVILQLQVDNCLSELESGDFGDDVSLIDLIRILT